MQVVEVEVEVEVEVVVEAVRGNSILKTLRAVPLSWRSSQLPAVTLAEWAKQVNVVELAVWLWWQVPRAPRGS
jgi:hypothetical protein